MIEAGGRRELDRLLARIERELSRPVGREMLARAEAKWRAAGGRWPEELRGDEGWSGVTAIG
jgi:hypothetical protein